MHDAPPAVVFDIGRVLFDWNLKDQFEKPIAEARFGRPGEALFFTDDNPATSPARGWRAYLLADAGSLGAELVALDLLD